MYILLDVCMRLWMGWSRRHSALDMLGITILNLSDWQDWDSNQRWFTLCLYSNNGLTKTAPGHRQDSDEDTGVQYHQWPAAVQPLWPWTGHMPAVNTAHRALSNCAITSTQLQPGSMAWYKSLSVAHSSGKKLATYVRHASVTVYRGHGT